MAIFLVLERGGGEGKDVRPSVLHRWRYRESPREEVPAQAIPSQGEEKRDGDLNFSTRLKSTCPKKRVDLFFLR